MASGFKSSSSPIVLLHGDVHVKKQFINENEFYVCFPTLFMYDAFYAAGALYLSAISLEISHKAKVTLHEQKPFEWCKQSRDEFEKLDLNWLESFRH